MEKILEFDCGVIGGGLAGMSAALELADAGKKVALFTKEKLIEDSNSYLIAGGLAGVSMPNFLGDSLEIHEKETLNAGAGLNDPKIVEFSIKNFHKEVIEWLIAKGVGFDKDNGNYDLHKEGGHSKERIFHVKDTTGKTIIQVLGGIVQKHPNIDVYENHMVIDLITENKISPIKKEKDNCLGFYVYDWENDVVKTIQCIGTFIATGGLGKVFLHTSNQDIATGDGFALGYRAGLPLANMEFVQFHPSVFYDVNADKGERIFLLTEALRGAGAFLKLDKNDKEDFVLNYHELGSRATRDVVSKAEHSEMRKHGLNHVWLDCTNIPEEKLKNDFKNAYEFCLKKGIDITKESIPVVYAEHYANGGVLVDRNSKTELSNCYVIGESSYTGLHGATRLASNSGPECVLFGRLAAKDFISNNSKFEKIEIPLWDPGRAKDSRDKETVYYYWDTIRRTMSLLCGVSRNEERLIAAKLILESLRESIKEFYWNYKVTKEFLEVRNIVDVALVIVNSALERKESRACHFREDYPNQDDGNYLGISVVRRGRGSYIQNQGVKK